MAIRPAVQPPSDSRGKRVVHCRMAESALNTHRAKIPALVKKAGSRSTIRVEINLLLEPLILSFVGRKYPSATRSYCKTRTLAFSKPLRVLCEARQLRNLPEAGHSTWRVPFNASRCCQCSARRRCNSGCSAEAATAQRRTNNAGNLRARGWRPAARRG
jgi:radical SAM protein with 4Fe4S-binding SPASM domain